MQREIEYLLDELDKADPGRRPEVRQLIEKLRSQQIGKDVAQNLINEAFKDGLVVDASDRLGHTKYTTVPENIQCDLTIKGFEYLNQIRKKKVTGGTGITASGDVNIIGISGQLAIGQNITQTQTLSTIDKKELLDSLLEFQKEITGLGIPEDDLSTVNGDLNAAIKEAKKEEPNASRIKKRFEGAVETIKDAGDFIEKVSKWEWTGKILKILGKLGLTIML